MGNLTSKGYEVTAYAQKRKDLEGLFKNAFPALRTDEVSAQGQLIDYIVRLSDNEDKIGLSFFNQLNYRNAEGALLSMIAVSKGQPRNSGTKAVIDCDFTSSDSPYTISANSIFVDTVSSIKFTNFSDIVIDSSPQSVQLVAVSNGATGLDVGAQLSAQTYLPALTNASIEAIEDGTNDESDEDLIDRLSASDSESGNGDVAAIYDGLNRTANVTRVRVIENDTNATVDGVTRNGIEAIVLGGLDSDIANVISRKKASGTPTSGGVTVQVTDTQGFPKAIRFTRPSLVASYVKITLTNREGTSISGNIDGLRQTTMNYINALKIGADVSRTPIFGIWGSGGNFDIVKIELSTDDVTWVEANISIATRAYAFVENLAQIIVVYA